MVLSYTTALFANLLLEFSPCKKVLLTTHSTSNQSHTTTQATSNQSHTSISSTSNQSHTSIFSTFNQSRTSINSTNYAKKTIIQPLNYKKVDNQPIILHQKPIDQFHTPPTTSPTNRSWFSTGRGRVRRGSHRWC